MAVQYLEAWLATVMDQAAPVQVPSGGWVDMGGASCRALDPLDLFMIFHTRANRHPHRCCRVVSSPLFTEYLKRLPSKRRTTP